MSAQPALTVPEVVAVMDAQRAAIVSGTAPPAAVAAWLGHLTTVARWAAAALADVALADVARARRLPPDAAFWQNALYFTAEDIAAALAPHGGPRT